MYDIDPTRLDAMRREAPLLMAPLGAASIIP